MEIYFAPLAKAVQFDGSNQDEISSFLEQSSPSETEFRFSDSLVIECRQVGFYGPDAQWEDWMGPTPVNAGDWVSNGSGIWSADVMADPTRFYTRTV